MFKTSICVLALCSLLKLEATSLTTEFYPADKVPKRYQETKEKNDATVIRLDEKLSNSLTSITEDRLTKPEIKKIPVPKGAAKAPFEWAVSSAGYIPGEPVTYSFIGPRKRVMEKITIVPNRLIAKSTSDNAAVEARLLQLHPVSYAIKMSNFENNEELQFHSYSYDEKIEQSLNTRDYKMIHCMPGVIGKLGGIAKVTFTRKSGEVLSLEMPWGLEWVKYVLYFDENQQIKSIIEDAHYLKENPKIDNYFKSNRFPNSYSKIEISSNPESSN